MPKPWSCLHALHRARHGCRWFVSSFLASILSSHNNATAAISQMHGCCPEALYERPGADDIHRVTSMEDLVLNGKTASM